MPARNISVNLLEKDSLSESPIGRIILWITTYGRYIMITTEILVLLAFISRFSIDRKLTDLNEAIAQKQAIIEANIPFEKDFLSLQQEISRIKSLTDNQDKPIQLLKTLKSLLPQDVYFEKLEISPTAVIAIIKSGSTQGLAVFMRNLQLAKEFTNVDIQNVSKDQPSGIYMKFTASLITPKIQMKLEQANETSFE